MYDDHALSGLSRVDCRKLEREIAPEPEVRAVMGLSGFVPTTPDAFRIRPFGINGKPTKHKRYRFLGPHKGRNGKQQRYTQERGTGCYAHFSPLLSGGQKKAWADKKQVKVLTEGEKKGDCAAKHGIANAAFPGVNNYVVKETGELIPEIDKLDLDGHGLAIVYDSDATTNPRVMNARNDLARRLKAKGAVVYWIALPPGPNGEKVGLDDFLVQHGRKPFDELPCVELTDDELLTDDHRRLTDVGNANRLISALADRAIYVRELSVWYFFDGLCWRPDKTGRIWQEAKAIARGIYKEASREKNDEQRKKVGKHAANTENEARLRAMIKLSTTDPRIAVTQDKLDSDPWLLCVANAIIDLRTGKPISPDPDQFITRQATVAYEPEAQAPHWTAFLEKVLPDTSLRTFVRRCIGYSITGSTSEQVLIFLYGNGQNGKSAVIETLSYLLGDYSASAPSSMLMKTHNDAIPNDVARLRGCRLAALSELDVGDRFNEAKLKLYTGSDSIPARFLHQEWFEFIPSFKPWLHGNHKPLIRGQDKGIWRRMMLVPFDTEIPDSERVLDFAKTYLYPESSGILNWALRGCLEWQSKGLAQPAIIKSQTDMYRDESDILGDFVAERCDVGEKHQAGATELYAAYKQFCDDRSDRAMSSNMFGRLLGERYERLGKNRPVKYRGLQPKVKRRKRRRAVQKYS